MLEKKLNKAKFSIGEVVRHRLFDFRGVIYDVDFQFNNSEEWYQSIPKAARPRKDQPFYHLLAENDEITYEAYVSEQNLVGDDPNEPVRHPLVMKYSEGKEEIFTLNHQISRNSYRLNSNNFNTKVRQIILLDFS